MKTWICTSGFQYPEWKGKFYPEKMPPAKMLAFYPAEFRSTEVNYTFRSLPSAKTIDRWRDETPEDFRFSLKAPQRVTHFAKLRSCADTVNEFHHAVNGLGKKLGPVLFQLPETFKVDAVLLAEFVQSLPKGLRAAFEFRHELRFTDDVFETLTESNAALCVAESEDLATPRIATADFSPRNPPRRLTYSPRSSWAWRIGVRHSLGRDFPENRCIPSQIPLSFSTSIMTFSHLKLLLLTLLTALPLSAFQLPSNSSQCLVGIADDWNSSHVTLTLYEKQGGAWKPAAEPWKARLGKSGLTWGLGMHPVPSGVPIKKEGDMRTPAGVFAIGGAWGKDASIRKHPKLFYRQVTSRDLWVEDPASPQYNRNVILEHDPATAWEKKQQMKQNDAAHALKLFIAHNAPPKAVPNAGSSIFFHIWRGGGSRPTAGCTTMEETKLRWLISQIDPDRRPLYVVLPKVEYAKFRAPWKLP